MAKATTNSHLRLNNGDGTHAPIATGVFQTHALDMSETRRLSLTANFGGGFTGILLIQGTDEIGNASIANGTGPSRAWAGAGPQPGENGFTGALYWNTLPSGTIQVTNSTTNFTTQLTDVGNRWVRLNFNNGITTAIGSAVGSGAIDLFVTLKHT